MKTELIVISLMANMALFLGLFTYNINECNAKGKFFQIGERGPAGGWVFYDKGSYSNGWRYLEAAPDNQGETVWGCYGKAIQGTRNTAIGTGKYNTQAIIRECGEVEIAAKLAVSYRGGGKSDWFLPSRDELGLMLENLYGKGVAGIHESLWYWSSSEDYPDIAWCQRGLWGGQYLPKNNRYIVRAVRAF
jgi:hypothetical protein